MGLAIAGVGAASAWAAPGASAGTFLTPAVDLSASGQDAGQNQVAIDASGNSVAVWVRNGVVQYAFRATGGANAFSTGADMPGASTTTSNVHVAMDSGGDAAAVWQTSGGLIQAAYMPAGSGGTFGSAQTLETDATFKPVNPAIALDGNGNAVAVWEHSDGANLRIEALYGAGGAFSGTPQIVSPAGHPATDPQVGMDPSGNATAVWLESDGTNVLVQTAGRPSGDVTTFGSTSAVSGGANAADVRLAVDQNGNVMAVWDDDTGRIQVAYMPVGLSFDSAVTLETDATHKPVLPAVAFDSLGDAEAVWEHSNGTFIRVEAANAPSGGTFGSAAAISANTEDATNPQVAMDGNGDALAVWQGASTQQIQAAVQPSGQSSFNSPTAISAAGQAATSASVAMTSNGADGIAGWQRFNGTNIIAQVAGYDGGPSFQAVHIPPAPSAGHGVTLFTQATDTWSPMTVSWDFGDGAHATGANVSHSYASAGGFTATVTVSDSQSLQVQSGQSLTVASPPAPVPGGLRELDSPNDCVAGAAFGCGTLLPFTTAFAYQPAISPDGRSVYFSSLFGNFSEFARDPATGALTENGCLTAGATPGCTTVSNSGLNGAAAAVVSPDGKNVYMIGQGDNAVVSLARDPTTGALTWLSCIGQPPTGCGNSSGKGLGTPYGITISPDGKNVYVSSDSDQAVAEFDRDPSTGELTQKAAPNNCISGTAGSGCGVINATGMANTIGIAISPDGNNVYIEAGGTLGGGDIAEFSRNPATGSLAQLPAPNDTIIGSINGTEDMALSPDGRFTYVNSFANNAVVELSRDSSTGALTQIGCVTADVSGCAVTGATGISGSLGVAVSPDGANLYVSGAGTGSEAAFARDPATGLLLSSPHRLTA